MLSTAPRAHLFQTCPESSNCDEKFWHVARATARLRLRGLVYPQHTGTLYVAHSHLSIGFSAFGGHFNRTNAGSGAGNAPQDHTRHIIF